MEMQVTNPATTSKTTLLSGLWGNAYLLLSLASLFWSGNFVVSRALVATTPPIAMAFWRWTIAFLVMAIVAWPHLRKDWPLLKQQWLLVFVLGALGTGAYNALTYIGLQTTTSINGLLMQSVMPMLIFVVAFLIYFEVPTKRQLLGIILSFTGVAFIASHGHLLSLAQLQINPGDLWLLSAVIVYCFYSVLLRKRPKVHPLSFLMASFAAGALVLLPFYLHEHLTQGHFPVNLDTTLGLIYLVIFPSFLSYLCFNRGVELIGAGRAGGFIHLMPVFGSVLAMVFLGERFESYHLWGAVLIAIGLVIATLKRKA